VQIIPDNLMLPSKTLFGQGLLGSLIPECAHFGSRGLLVHGAALDDRGLVARMLAEAPRQIAVLPYRHRGGEPTLDQVADVLRLARGHQSDWVAGIGGGSVLDLAKAIAGLYNASNDLVFYHDGGTIEQRGIAFAAVPTTAGSGSEATLNAVLTNAATGAKKSIRDAGLMARLVILDPDLLATCPPEVIAASGMDAFPQAVESFTSRKATWLSDQLAIKGLALISTNLEAVHTDPHSPRSAELLLGSYLTGLALSFGRLGVVHGIAHPLGALYRVPHGLVCAVCLPHAIELNRTAFGAKYNAMTTALGEDLQSRVQDLLSRLHVVSPFAGQPIRARDDIIRETLASGSTACNPRAITRQDVETLLDKLFAARQS
jgi:alcohol dehydrogenase class IV